MSANPASAQNWIVIPARLKSTRLPEKVLLDLGGKSILAHVIDKCRAATKAEGILVATDDTRILEEAQHCGVAAVMTREDHSCGTDRIAEAVAAHDAPVARIVNVQGDEPFVDPALIDALFEALEAGEPMVTAGTDLPDAFLDDPARVKIVLNHANRAMYFSRYPIPFRRNPQDTLATVWHMGIYGYSRETLERITTLEPCALEQAESLEQLRALYHGITIKVIHTQHQGISIDTQADLDLARQQLKP